MGCGNWDNQAKATYATRTASHVGKSQDQVFRQSIHRKVHKDLDPTNITIRESRDSEQNPESTPIIVSLDVTGSMGILADKLAREGLGTFFEEVLTRKPVTDPHLMFMGIGDMQYDSGPLQVSQFEADIRVAEQLELLWLEKGGGGNCFESYDMAWAFAATKTSIDSFEKRGKKGYLFTIGDDNFPDSNRGFDLGRVGFHDIPTDPRYLYEAACEKYHVFHIIVEQGSNMRINFDHGANRIVSKWRELLGKRAILLSDINYIPQVIVSAMLVNEGANPEEVVHMWEDTSVGAAVNHALFD